MRYLKIVLPIVAALLLNACGKSPTEQYLEICKGSPSECKCTAESLEKKLDKKEFQALVDEVKKIQPGEEQSMGFAIIKGTFVNEKVSQAFLTASKACSEKGKAKPAAPAEAPAPAPAPAPAAVAPAAAPVDAAAEELKAINGIWYSSQWKYGYELKNGKGIATATNSPKFKAGDEIIRLEASHPGSYVGEQIYKDGKFYRVNATLGQDGKLYFEGEKNVKWFMERVK